MVRAMRWLPAVITLSVDQLSWWTRVRRRGRGRPPYALSRVAPLGERSQAYCAEGWITYQNMPATVRRA